MTTIMVRSIQFGKIVKQAGQNKRARRKYFSVHYGTRRPFVSFSHKTFSRQV